jgi:hypothetical protein
VAILHDQDPKINFPRVYMELRINDDTLTHLAQIGLVRIVEENLRVYDDPVVDVEYFGDCRTFIISEKEPREYLINFGCVTLTRVGWELARIAGAEPVGGFFDFLEAEWAKVGISRQL